MNTPSASPSYPDHMARRHLPLLFAAMRGAGIWQIVVCPGSRSAPLTLLAARTGSFKIHRMLDERSAGFFALGLAQAYGEQVAIITTSGTAAVNLAPAITEAYYQRRRLLVLTADRPAYAIDQQQGQAIHQDELYRPHLAYQATLPLDCTTDKHYQHAYRLIIEALNGDIRAPVHLNIPLEEPLYLPLKPIDPIQMPREALDKQVSYDCTLEYPEGEQILVVASESEKNIFNTPFLTGDNFCGEALSNFNEYSLECWLIRAERGEVPYPNAQHLVVFGIGLVSKRIRRWLAAQPWKTITIEQPAGQPTMSLVFTYGTPTHTYSSDQRYTVCDGLYDRYKSQLVVPPEGAAQPAALPDTPEPTDLYAFQTFLREIEKVVLQDYEKLDVYWPTPVHLANSLSVRLADRMPARLRMKALFLANRGTAGIDGCTSTALGYASARGFTTLVTGDAAFLYDAGALLTLSKEPPNLRILVLNNDGGRIFGYLPEAQTTPELEKLFAMPHGRSAAAIATAYGHETRVFNASNIDALDGPEGMQWLLDPTYKGIRLLEVFVDPVLSYKRFLQTALPIE